jgi:hypothetical protein
MRLATATIGASLLWVACSMAGPALPGVVDPGKHFSLKSGESVQTRDKALRIGFETVSADSRCPKGEMCVWAGDATVHVWLQQGSGPRQTRELHTAPGARQSARVLNVEVRLVRLEPYPVTGKPIAAPDYVATLTLNIGAGVDPDR